MKLKLPVVLSIKTYLTKFVIFTLFLFPLTSIKASFNFTKNSLPVFPPSSISTNWDSKHVEDSFLLDLGDSYGMWYSGHGTYDGGIYDHWLLGYAQMNKITGLWSRSSSPLVFQGTSDLPQTEAVNPFLIKEVDGTYKIWYDAYNPPQSAIRYATSIDGQTWTKYPSAVLIGTSGRFDGAGLAGGVSIVRDNDGYHMWYTGSAGGGTWGIGYATSTDGINWTKQNDGNPIITKTELWEYDNLRSAHVFFAYGRYHMFYATGPQSLNVPIRIVYANSMDGIHWEKPADLNPVLDYNEYPWENDHISAPFVLIDDNKLKMWLSVSGVLSANNPNDIRWQIAYAEAPLSKLPGAPTPISTPTDTPAPTPTPTPTSTPTPTRKVLFIPGGTASWNLDAFINCKKDNYKGTWSLFGPAKELYAPLIQSLKNAGWQASVFPYDWRKQISDHSEELKTFIENLTSPSEKIDVVGHSMGGLLARAYIEQEKTNSKVEKLITVGSPHDGATMAYPSWSAGEIPKGDLTSRFMLTLLVKRCALKTHNDRLAVQEYIPGLQNLLPTFNYLTDNLTNIVKPVTSMLEQNNWLPTTFTPPFFGTIVGTLSGTGQPTPQGYRVINPSFSDLNLGNWVDGKPVITLTTLDGDGTVLVSSATLTGADNRTIIGTHPGIVTSQLGISQILDFLTNNKALANINGIQMLNKQKNQEQQVINSSLYFVVNPADFWLIDEHGKITKGSEGIISLTNPKSSEYTLLIVPKSNETTLIVSQELGEKFFYKEYSLQNRLPKIKLIHFDSKHPKEDILR